MEEGFLFYYDTDGGRADGWQEADGDLFYFRPEAAENAPAGSAAIGFQKIGKYSFYFDEQGRLQTGWQEIGGKTYYFTPSGDPGRVGAMYVGVKTIDGKRYYFDEKGRMRTGWLTYHDKTFYFSKSKSASKRGAAVTSWQTIGGERYSFNAKGVLRKNCWVSKKYYVGADGKMLKSCVTPDGYLVDDQGRKGKKASGFVKIGDNTYYYLSGERITGFKTINGCRYYFQKDGIRQESGWVTSGSKKFYIKDGVIQTGWQYCDGKKYYFSSSGRLVTNKTVDGIKIAEDGTVPISILLIAGHGQGDPGAMGRYGTVLYQEFNFTREFSTLIYKKLKKLRPDINLVMYDQNYDCYQVIAKKKSGPDPNFKAYDYVLEVHFNATIESMKDSSGDGVCKGVGIYVNAAKKNTAIDKSILAAVTQASGLPVRDTGLWLSPGLLNAKTCQSLGVSYGLLETAFIDDKDDMTVYSKKKSDMASAVAKAISDYFSN